MDKLLKRYIILGIIFVSFLGTISHFFYNLSNSNFFVGLFSPVNESTWEHIKLLFFPMLFYSLFLSHQLKSKYPCVVSALCIGILAGCLLIPAIFYTYTGILGFHILFLDIATFYISVIIAFYVTYKLTLNCKASALKQLLIVIIVLLCILFFIFTYSPPNLNLFSLP